MVSTVNPNADLSIVVGVSEQDAIAKLKQDGYNELPSSRFFGFASF